MRRAKRDRRHGQPGDAGLDEGTGPPAEDEHEDDPPPADVREDPPMADVRGDPPVASAHDGPPTTDVREDPLVEDAHEDPPVAAAHKDPPADVREDPLVEDVHEGPPVAAAHEDPLAAGVAGDGENERFVARWQEIQAGFVDEPRRAVQDADALVVDLMDRLARVLAEERDRLEPRPGTGENVSTEDLRQGLRRYRSLFERLLAV